MSNLSNDFVTVDMRGLKAALVERAQAERVSVSVLVRRAVAIELKATQLGSSRTLRPTGSTSIKVSIRLTGSEARQLKLRALADGISMGALLTRLAAEVPALASRPNRVELLSALIESNAELSALSRNINHLAALLRQGSVQAAREYRLMLEGLTGEVRAHLQMVSTALTELHPGRAAPDRVQRSPT